MDVCVCLSGADGRMVEGRATLFRPPPRGRQGSPAGWATYGCRVVCVLCRPERRKERRGWAWVAGESTPEPHRTTKGKKREKQLADRKVPDRPGVVKGEGLKKQEKEEE
ncbi:hypothetical protein MTP99_011325 [Tenebrio molitor]|jgi:hypothetical protein|nr:hypothetical protein MTP99_011325 [Tenebrio molitor]